MRNQWRLLPCFVAILGLLLVPGCGNSGGTPTSIAGVWLLEIVGATCPDLSGALNPGEGPSASFQVTQSGINVSSQFVDQVGAQGTLNATLRGDQVRGSLQLSEGRGRTIVASIEGYARTIRGQRQVDGWARIEVDSENLCIGEIVEFCAIIDGEGGTTPPPPPPPPPAQTCPPLDIVLLVTTGGGNSEAVGTLCQQEGFLDSAIRELGPSNLRMRILGVTDSNQSQVQGTSPLECVSDSVRNLLGDGVPGTPPPGHELLNDQSDWGGGAAIVADRYPWLAGHLRVLIPISSEGPEKPGGNANADDAESAANLVNVATPKQVGVYPIHTEVDAAVFANFITVANGTGGIAQQTDFPAQDIVEFILLAVEHACDNDTVPPNIPPSPPPPPPTLTDAQIIAQCPDVDIVFLIDTSGSMLDDIFLMCGGDLRDVVQFSTPIPVPLTVVGALEQVEARLTALGANVQSRILGITEDGGLARRRLGVELPQLGLPPPPDIAFDCIRDDEYVTEVLTDQVPVHPSISGPILFETDIDNGAPGGQTGVEHAYESWGSAIAIVANADNIEPGFWRPGALRIIVPVSDEGPERGMSLPPTQVDSGQDGDCDAADVQAVDNAIAIARDNGVIVAGIAAFLINAPNPQGIFHPCVTNDQGTGEMDRLAAATGGVVTRSVNLTTLVNDILSQNPSIIELPSLIQDVTEPLEDAIYQIVLESCRTVVLDR